MSEPERMEIVGKSDTSLSAALKEVPAVAEAERVAWQKKQQGFAGEIAFALMAFGAKDFKKAHLHLNIAKMALLAIAPDTTNL